MRNNIIMEALSWNQDTSTRSKKGIIGENEFQRLEKLLKAKEIQENVSTMKKESLISMMQHWINIRDEVSYLALKQLVLDRADIQLCNFTDIKETKFTLIMSNTPGRINVFPIHEIKNSSKINFNAIQSIWFIENGEFHEHTRGQRIQIGATSELNGTDFRWSPLSQEKKAEKPPQDDSYVIKKWDSLWKVVKQKYQWLQTNRDIIAAINAIVQANSNIKRLQTDTTQPPDGILGDLIHENNTLTLPGILETKDGKRIQLKARKK